MKGVRIGKVDLTINHQLFANECILFGDASAARARTVQGIISDMKLFQGKK